MNARDIDISRAFVYSKYMNYEIITLHTGHSITLTNPSIGTLISVLGNHGISMDRAEMMLKDLDFNRAQWFSGIYVRII